MERVTDRSAPAGTWTEKERRRKRENKRGGGEGGGVIGEEESGFKFECLIGQAKFN